MLMQINHRNRSLSIRSDNGSITKSIKNGEIFKKSFISGIFVQVSCKNSVDQPRKSVRRNIIWIYTMDMNQVIFILVYISYGPYGKEGRFWIRQTLKEFKQSLNISTV